MGEAIVMISSITLVVVISAILLTLANAYSHGALARLVFKDKEEAQAKAPPAQGGQHREQTYQRAA